MIEYTLAIIICSKQIDTLTSHTPYDTRTVHLCHLHAKLGLLLSAVGALEVGNPVLAVELDLNLIVEGCRSAVQSAGLDNGQIGEDIKLGVQAGAAIGAEKVFVVLARLAGDVVCLRCS